MKDDTTVALEIPVMPPVNELPLEVQNLRKERDRKFVWFYMMGRANGAQAARLAGFSDHLDAAKVQAHHLLHRKDIQDALTAMGQRYLYHLMPKALVVLNELLEHPSPAERGKAVERVLNRVPGFGVKTEVDVNVSGSVEVNHTDAALDDLRRLKVLGVSRAALLETFGHSGLERYEKMLAERRPKMIEGEVISSGTD